MASRTRADSAQIPFSLLEKQNKNKLLLLLLLLPASPHGVILLESIVEPEPLGAAAAQLQSQRRTQLITTGMHGLEAWTGRCRLCCKACHACAPARARCCTVGSWRKCSARGGQEGRS